MHDIVACLTLSSSLSRTVTLCQIESSNFGPGDFYCPAPRGIHQYNSCIDVIWWMWIFIPRSYTHTYTSGSPISLHDLRYGQGPPCIMPPTPWSANYANLPTFVRDEMILLLYTTRPARGTVTSRLPTTWLFSVMVLIVVGRNCRKHLCWSCTLEYCPTLLPKFPKADASSPAAAQHGVCSRLELRDAVGAVVVPAWRGDLRNDGHEDVCRKRWISWVVGH